METHKDLEVWKKSITLVTKIYEITKGFPKEETYGITNQIRRCAVSIPSNIAEGAARESLKEFIHFLTISLGSIAELETQLIISNNIGYLTTESQEETQLDIIEIRKMLIGLKKSLSNKIN